jgi:hypothetical protein
VALIRPVAFGPKLGPQLLVSANCTALAGDTAILLMLNSEPVFVSVIPTGALVRPIVCVPNASTHCSL